MQFKNDSHKSRFMKTIKGMNQKDNTQMALAFLLTADQKLPFFLAVEVSSMSFAI